MAHTPGPWGINETTLSICRLIVSVEDVRALQISPVANPGYVVAYLPNDYEQEQQAANARLIAAAPDLLEALKKLAYTVESRFEGLEIVALVPQDLRRDIQQARAVIDRAEGREASAQQMVVGDAGCD